MKMGVYTTAQRVLLISIIGKFWSHVYRLELMTFRFSLKAGASSTRILVRLKLKLKTYRTLSNVLKRVNYSKQLFPKFYSERD